MERGVITISETGVVTMPTAPVWMTKFEIADLLGVFSYDCIFRSIPVHIPVAYKA